MAAPSATTWGTIQGGEGRIGIYTSLTNTNTQTTVAVEVWFWSKYSVVDSNNTYYYDNRSSSGSATTSKGSVSINHQVSTGSGWSTSNQTKLGSYTYTYTRGTTAATRYLYAKFVNIDVVGSAMSVSKTITIPAKPSYTVSYNANGGSGAPGNQTKWYGTDLTLSGTKPTRTGYSFQGWGTSANDTSVNYAAGATYTANASVTLYAIWKANTYTVSYNANGGSGAPSSQTKTYGVTLKLSGTKPTRTGYSFQGWGTSAGDTSVDYAAGANYTANSAITLYAIWKANTYTVSYNANGGTGAPGNQTKTYGVALTLSSTKPTRTNYNFKGWAVSASATSADYQAGGSYTANAAVTLYAVWELAYVAPRIANLTLTRCDSAGTANDAGTYARVAFSWVCFLAVSSIEIRWKPSSGTTWTSSTVSASGTSGSVNTIVGEGDLNSEWTYQFQIIVSDTSGSTTTGGTLSGAFFVIDFLDGGEGAAFGKAAERKNTLDMGWDIELNDNELLRNGSPAFAPAGYGYGETIPVVTLASEAELETWLDNKLSTMEIASSCQCAFAVSGISVYNFIGRLYKTSDYEGGYAYLDCCLYDGILSNKGVKVKTTGIWKPFEWVNPPMVLGVEYRTTKRHNGSVVYAKAIDCGNIPSVSQKSVSHGVTGITYVLSCTGFTDNAGASLPYYAMGNNLNYPTVSVNATRSGVVISSQAGTWTGYKCFVILEYTK